MTKLTFFLSLFVLLQLTGCDKSNDVELPVLTPDYSDNPEMKEKMDALKSPNPSANAAEKKKTTKVKKTTKPKKTKTRKKTKKATYSSTQSFTGGKISDGLDIHKIRASANPARTRLVFESYSKGTKAINSGNYLFTYDSKTLTITALIDGYRRFSALSGAKEATFPAGSMVEHIKLLPYMDDSGYKFTIKIKEESQVKVFELKNPGRIVVDINKIY